MGYGEFAVENMHNKNPAKISAGLYSLLHLSNWFGSLLIIGKVFSCCQLLGEWYFLFAQNCNKAVQNIVTNSKSFACIKLKGLCIPI